MEKAQKGDLIRIVEADDTRYKNGDIFEVVEDFDSEGVFVDTPDDSNVLVYDEEYVIHRKAGEEDSALDIVKQAVDKANETPKSLVDGIYVRNEQADAVNPQHYKQGRVEVIDIIEDAVEGADPFEAVCQANVLKYALRYRAKNGVEDLRKMLWYGEKLVAYLDAKSTQD